MATRRRASRQSLTGSINDLQRRVKYLQNKPSPTRLGNQSVLRSALQPRAVGNDQIALNAITNDQIQADAIKQAQIDNNSVGTAELIGLSVTNEKIALGTIENDRMAEDSIDYINMIPNSVRSDTLDQDSVNFRALAINAVGNENMLGDSVGNAELQNNSVGNGEMQDNSISSSELQTDSVGNAELQSNSVGTAQLQSGAVTSSKIASGNVGSTQLGGSSVTEAKIATGAVTNSKLGSSSVTSNKINNATYSIIVRDGLSVSSGISKSASTISANFGNGSAQVARGNHRHSAGVGSSNSNVIVLSSNVARAGHAHTVTISAPISSSLRYKKEIQTHKPENLHALLKLEMKKYKYKNSHRDAHTLYNSEWMYGYIAEEVEDLGLVEIVSYNEDGQPEALNYSLLSALLLELVKEQQQDIELLKKDVKELLGTKND